MNSSKNINKKEMNQDLVENTTKESMKNSYIGDELFTCTE